MNQTKGSVNHKTVEDEKAELLQEIQSTKKDLIAKNSELKRMAEEIGNMRRSRVELDRGKLELARANKQLQDEIMKQKFQHEEEARQWERKLSELNTSNEERRSGRTVETFPARMRRKVAPIKASRRAGLASYSTHMLKANNFVI